mgnify:CR=1 FL=1
MDADKPSSLSRADPPVVLLTPTRRFLAGVGLVVLAISIWGVYRSVAASAPDEREPSLPLVSIVVPGLQAISDVVSFTGTIRARDELPITVEGEGGRVAAVLVEAGDRVQRGQLLARLTTTVAQPQVESLAAGLEQARADAELAAAEYARARAVADSGALSAQEIERRRSAQLSAAARVKVASAQLNEARARLSRTDIRAPAAGLVLTRAAEVGQTATVGGEPLFRLSRGGEIEMLGSVAEQDLPRLVVGQPASVRITGVETAFVGKVRLLGPVIDPQSRLGSVHISLPSDSRLRPGAFARGEAEVGVAQRALLPQTAIMADGDGTYVLIVDAEDRVQRRAVRVAATRDAGVVVEQGLDGTERVVTTAGAFLRAGEKIAVLDAAS